VTFEQSAAETRSPGAGPADRAEIERMLSSYLHTRLKTAVEPEQDLFARGLVTSMFAMELVIHLEQSFDVSIVGSDLQLQNFRSVEAMTTLVLRLRSDNGR
jgi:methoxymalonate biosynthesis acyl carrier protein